MLVQIDDLPQYDGVDMLEMDRQVLEEEEVLEREYLRDDGEEDEELEQQVVIIILFQHVSFLLHKYLKLISSLCRRWQVRGEE